MANNMSDILKQAQALQSKLTELQGEAAGKTVEASAGGGAYAANPESDLIAMADAARLEAAIATLPPHFRDTLVLRDIQGLDYREIAAVTDVPVGTVMSRLARARQRLIRAIEAGE